MLQHVLGEYKRNNIMFTAGLKVVFDMTLAWEATKNWDARIGWVERPKKSRAQKKIREGGQEDGEDSEDDVDESGDDF